VKLFNSPTFFTLVGIVIIILSIYQLTKKYVEKKYVDDMGIAVMINREIIKVTARFAFDDGKHIGYDVAINWRHGKLFDKTFEEWWVQHTNVFLIK